MMANWSLGVPHFQTNLHLIRLLMTGGSLVSFATMCWENRNCNWNKGDSVFLRFWKYMMNSFVDFISLCLRRAAALFKVEAQILERTFQLKCQWCLLESRCLWCREHQILDNRLSEKGLTAKFRALSCLYHAYIIVLIIFSGQLLHQCLRDSAARGGDLGSLQGSGSTKSRPFMTFGWHLDDIWMIFWCSNFAWLDI